MVTCEIKQKQNTETILKKWSSLFDEKLGLRNSVGLLQDQSVCFRFFLFDTLVSFCDDSFIRREETLKRCPLA